MSHKHTISVLVENEFGVLARVAGMFAARGYNIDSLSVAPTSDPRYSRMTILTSGSELIIEQILKQLNRLLDTVKVQDLTGESFISREMILVKVKSSTASESGVLTIAENYKAKVVDKSPESITLEYTGEHEKVNSLLSELLPFGVLEDVRTGAVAIQKGKAHIDG